MKTTIVQFRICQSVSMRFANAVELNKYSAIFQHLDLGTCIVSSLHPRSLS
jgi:hypothetical protein